MNHLADVLAFLPVLAALLLLGGSLARPERTLLENALLPGALALGLYALAVWATGLLWRLVPGFWIAAPWLPLIILAVVRRQCLGLSLRQWASCLRSLTRVEGLLCLYLLAAFGLTFFLTLAPPNGLDYDSLTYHLAVPAQYLRYGRVVELRYDHHSYFPLTLEMLYTLALAARGPVLAKLFHWLMLPLGCGALAAMGHRLGGRRAGLLAACLYASMPMVLAEATTAYIDLGFVAYALFATLCFLNAAESEEPRNWLIWAGAFTGLCLGSKYFGALVFAFLGLWLQGSQLAGWRLQWRPVLAYAAPALLIGAPWYVRNWLWTGNPVFPFAYEVFGGSGWTLAMAKAYTVDQGHYGFGKSLLDLAWLPWRLGMTPVGAGAPFWPLNVSQRPPDFYWGVFDVRVLDILQRIFPGPLLLALGAPALAMPGKPRRLGIVAWFFGFLWIFWAVTSQQIRYLLPALALLCLVAGWAFGRPGGPYPWARRTAFCALGMWGSYAILIQVMNLERSRVPEFVVLLGQETDQDYLRRTFPGYRAMEWASANTPMNARFAVYGEARDYYLQRDYYWADDEHNNLVDYASLHTGAQLVASLKALGTTHVLIDTDPGRTGGAFGPPPVVNQAIQDGLLHPLFEANGYQVFALS